MKRLNKKLGYLLVVFGIVLVLILVFSKGSLAAGLFDDTVSSAHEYSKYSISNYQLDFFVDSSWDWLPWNWLDGIGKQITYGVHVLSNVLWFFLMSVANMTGYIVKQAFELDFISSLADVIGRNIQKLTGVSSGGFSASGFFVSSLLLIILILGFYIIYTGLIKKQTTKAFSSVINFLVVAFLSVSFFAYAPEYIKNVNDFSTDLSNSALRLGANLLLPGADTSVANNADLIRDNLFSLQIKQPWMFLQFGNTDIEAVGRDRVEGLLSVSPNDNNGKTREEIVKNEIETQGNNNLTVSGAFWRLANVILLLVLNCVISLFVILLCAFMIFSQILFVLMAMFLPMCLIVSLLPEQTSLAKKGLIKLFNVIFNRTALCIIITITFCISGMIYSMTATQPFIFVLFLQLLLFFGVFFKLNEILSMFSFQSSGVNKMQGGVRRKFMSGRRMLYTAMMYKLGRNSVFNNKDDKNKGNIKNNKSEKGERGTNNNKKNHARDTYSKTEDLKSKAEMGMPKADKPKSDINRVQFKPKVKPSYEKQGGKKDISKPKAASKPVEKSKAAKSVEKPNAAKSVEKSNAVKPVSVPKQKPTNVKPVMKRPNIVNAVKKPDVVNTVKKPESVPKDKKQNAVIADSFKKQRLINKEQKKIRSGEKQFKAESSKRSVSRNRVNNRDLRPDTLHQAAKNENSRMNAKNIKGNNFVYGNLKQKSERKNIRKARKKQ